MPVSQYQLDETWQEAVTIGVGKASCHARRMEPTGVPGAGVRLELRRRKEQGAESGAEAIGSPHALLCIGHADRLGVNPPRQGPGCFSAFLTGPPSDVQGQSYAVGMGWGHDAKCGARSETDGMGVAARPGPGGLHLGSHRGAPKDLACRCLYTWGPGSTPHPPHLCTRSQALLTWEPAGCVHAAQSHCHPGRECSERGSDGAAPAAALGAGIGVQRPRSAHLEM